jgi:hypothetical protein
MQDVCTVSALLLPDSNRLHCYVEHNTCIVQGCFFAFFINERVFALLCLSAVASGPHGILCLS